MNVELAFVSINSVAKEVAIPDGNIVDDFNYRIILRPSSALSSMNSWQGSDGAGVGLLASLVVVDFVVVVIVVGIVIAAGVVLFSAVVVVGVVMVGGGFQRSSLVRDPSGDPVSGLPATLFQSQHCLPHTCGYHNVVAESTSNVKCRLRQFHPALLGSLIRAP